MVFKLPISKELSIYLRFLHQEKGVSIKELRKRYPYLSQATLYRHAKNNVPMSVKSKIPSKRRGRPKKLTERQERNVLRWLYKLRHSTGSFSSKTIKVETGITEVSDRTIRRVLNKNGFFYLQCRKKGLLTHADKHKRVQFARHILRHYNNDIWTKSVCFYLDATSFVHKFNPLDQARAPRSRTWRKKNEGLLQGCTAKGSKVGHGGRIVHFMVAISYRRGVIICEPYEKMNGHYFALFVGRNVDQMFKDSGKGNSRMFLMDGDPSQNSKVARVVIDSCRAECLRIPPRSPDLNPIENMFHSINGKLGLDALQRNISKESYQEFSDHVIHAIVNHSIRDIDKTIESMPKRLKLIIKGKGERLKY